MGWELCLVGEGESGVWGSRVWEDFQNKNVRKAVDSTCFVADCLLQRSSPYEESLFFCCGCFWIFCFGWVFGGTGPDGTCSGWRDAAASGERGDFAYTERSFHRGADHGGDEG